MEVYILDSLYRRTAVVDRFESLIWSERWQDIGDVKITLPSTPVNRLLFAPKAQLALNESKRVMVVETIEDVTDNEGRTLLRVNGRSLEKICEDRAAIAGAVTTKQFPKWVITGSPRYVARLMFRRACIEGNVSTADVLPLYQEGNAYPEDTIPADLTEIRWEQEPDSLLNAIRDVCDLYSMGFRLYRDGDNGRLFFNVYTGNDRTTNQTVLSPVVFSPGLETVTNTTRLATVENAKNVAYVMNEQGFKVVYGQGVDPTVAGFERRVLIVKPPKLTMPGPDDTQIEPTAAELDAYLTLQGKYELVKNSEFMGFDGEITRDIPYRYGKDYELGDLVEMRDSDGMTNNMRVTEQIFVHDSEGERSYPTLTIDSFEISGTWDSWLGNREWSAFGTTEYWNTMP